MTFKNCSFIFAVFFFLSVIGQAQESNTTEKINTSKSDSKRQTPASSGTKKSHAEKITVTGSLIQRINLEGPSPLVIIDREEIEKSGFNEIGTLLRKSTVSPLGGSSSNANLKGLGPSRTLVLINGQRVSAVGDSYSSSTNINLVPLAAVERIEVLKAGASAIYGSDALAGVINIITRKNIADRYLNVKLSTPSQPGGSTLKASMAMGFETSRSSLTTSFQYGTSTQVNASDRNYLKDINKDFYFSNNYTNSNGQLKASPKCTPVNSNGRCEQALAHKSVSLPQHDFSGFVDYHYEIDSEMEMFSTLILRYTKDERRSFAAATSSGLKFKAGEAPSEWGALDDYDAGDPITIYQRLDEMGDRRYETDELSWGLTFGAKGYFGSDWTWMASNNTHQYLTDEMNYNFALKKEVKDAMEEGRYNPFDETKRDVTGFAHNPYSKSSYTINSSQFTSTGEIGRWLGADWSAAGGAFFQHSKYTDKRDQETLDSKVLGIEGATGSGERSVVAAFSEFQVLFGPSLEVQMALRHDQYSDFGGTTNPKLAARWQVSDSWMLRGTGGTGFQAPTLQDTYGPKLKGFVFLLDKKGCKANPNDAEICKSKGYPAQQGANPNLTEETSQSYSLGTVYQASKNLSFSLDYWKTKINDVVSSDIHGLLEIDALGVDVTKYGARIDRTSDGRIKFISAPLRNFANEDVDGFDLSTDYRFKAWAGNVSLRMDHVLMLHYLRSSYSELGAKEQLGTAGTPRWRNVLTLGYDRANGKWGASLIARTTDSLEKRNPDASKIPVYTEADLQTYYHSSMGKLRLGFNNVLNTQPTFDEGLSSKINSTLYDRLRTVYVTYETKF